MPCRRMPRSREDLPYRAGKLVEFADGRMTQRIRPTIRTVNPAEYKAGEIVGPLEESLFEVDGVTRVREHSWTRL